MENLSKEKLEKDDLAKEKRLVNRTIDPAIHGRGKRKRCPKEDEDFVSIDDDSSDDDGTNAITSTTKCTASEKFQEIRRVFYKYSEVVDGNYVCHIPTEMKPKNNSHHQTPFVDKSVIRHLKHWHPIQYNQMKNALSDPFKPLLQGRKFCENLVERLVAEKKRSVNLMKKFTSFNDIEEHQTRAKMFSVLACITGTVSFRQLLLNANLRRALRAPASQAEITSYTSMLVEKIRLSIIDELRSVSSVCLVYDGWQDHKLRKILGVAVHYVKNWTLRTLVLGMGVFGATEDAGNIKKAVKAIVDNFLNSDALISACVTDGGGGFPNSGKQVVGDDRSWIHCCAHRGDLVLKKSLKEAGFDELLEKVRNLVTQTKRNTALMELLSQNDIPEPCYNVATRWWSNVDMLEKWVRIQDHMCHAPDELAFRDVVALSDAEMSLIRFALPALNLIKQFIQFVEGSSYCTLPAVPSWVLRILIHLKTKDKEDLAADQQKLLRTLQMHVKQQFEDILDFRHPSMAWLAAFFDPKHHKFCMLEKYGENVVEFTALVEERLVKEFVFAIDFSKEGYSSTLKVELINELLVLVKAIIREAPQEMEDSCPIKFWKDAVNNRTGKDTLFTIFKPLLIKVVNMVLCVPASSASVERLFSSAKVFDSNLRQRMNVMKKENMCICFSALDNENSPLRSETIVDDVIRDIHLLNT